MEPYPLEFMFTVGHLEVYKEKDKEAYYWKFFDEDRFHGAFMSLQTCMSNYENVMLSQQGMSAALEKATQELKAIPPCPVVQSTQPNNSVIFVDFFNRKRRF